MYRVLISDKMSAQAAEVFRARGIEADEKPGMTPGELAAAINGYDGLAIRSATKVTADLLEAGTSLKVIGRAGIGVDNVDLAAATARGVAVMNTPFGNSITTAEHAIALMFALAREIPAADRSTQAGSWEKSRFMGVELTGKVLGIIGCGNIGSIVADRAIGLDMKVVAYDPYLAAERAGDLGVEKLGLDELLARADFITLHTPLNDDTRGIIAKKNIAKMKTGVRIINCARGGLIVEKDLKKALESGQVAGAALDVFSEEPATKNVLFGVPGVIATPHLGAATTEAQEKVAEQVAEQMADYLIDGAVTNAVNMPAVSAEEAPRLKPYMRLAEQLGGFAGQITQTGLLSVTIDYEGHVAGLNTTPLTAILLQGLLAPLLASVNMVNAPVIAKERDIRVTEARRQNGGDYSTLIRLTVTTEAHTRSVEGTLFADHKPRIIKINDINVEAELTEHVLYIVSVDQPGFIGTLGSILGDAGINIATFHLGRTGKGGDALALISVDQQIPQKVLKKLCSMEPVKVARSLTF